MADAAALAEQVSALAARVMALTAENKSLRARGGVVGTAPAHATAPSAAAAAPATTSRLPPAPAGGRAPAALRSGDELAAAAVVLRRAASDCGAAVAGAEGAVAAAAAAVDAEVRGVFLSREHLAAVAQGVLDYKAARDAEGGAAGAEAAALRAAHMAVVTEAEDARHTAARLEGLLAAAAGAGVVADLERRRREELAGQVAALSAALAQRDRTIATLLDDAEDAGALRRERDALEGVAERQQAEVDGLVLQVEQLRMRLARHGVGAH